MNKVKPSTIIICFLALVLLLTGCGGEAATNTTSAAATATTQGVQMSCNIEQGFHLNTENQDPVGHINYLKINGTEIPADFTVTDPENPARKTKVVGIVKWLMWEGKAGDPVVFAAQVSAGNKDRLAALGKNDLTGTEIEFSFTMYANVGWYFKAVSTNGQTLKGTLQTENGHLLYYISAEPGTIVAMPQNYDFQLGVAPGATRQEIMNGDQAERWGGE
jgi:hypothetical protein